MRILKLISIADIFTIINGLLGLGSIFATISGWYIFAVNLILLGVIADGLDGVFARRFSKKWYLGDYLDLMSDTVTFCVAPSVLLFTLYFESADLNNIGANLLDMYHAPLLIIFACGCIVVTGILRLARFSYQSPFMGDHFIGIPTPSAALALSLLMLLNIRLGEADLMTLSPTIVGAFTVLLALLMVSDIGYLKLKGRIEWLAGGLVLLAIVLNERLEVVAMVFGATMVYMIGGPLAHRKTTGKGKRPKKRKGRRKKGKKKRKEKGRKIEKRRRSLR